MTIGITKKNKSNNKKRGFTLVESLVAISILSMSIAATFTAVQNSLQNSSIAKDQTVAFYLAQEAVEFIKNRRDENALTSLNESPTVTKWLTGISDVTADECWFGGGGTNKKTCYVDVTAPTVPTDYTIQTCTGGFGTCPFLLKDSNNLFGHQSGTPTIFRREIQLRDVVTGREVEITVRMSWTDRWGPKSFTITENIFNRQ